MEEKINIFDVEIDGFTAKAAMQAAMQYMQSESINTIEVVTLDMLMQGQDNPEWKENTKAMDMVLPGEIEILEAAEITDRNLLRDVANEVFLKMFLKYLQRNRKRVFLIAQSEQELTTLTGVMGKYGRNIGIVGQGILADNGRSEEDIINDVNGAETDCILSVLPSPQQEEFIVRSSALLNARVWLGCGEAMIVNYNKKNKGGVRRFFLKRVFRYQVGKQKKEI